MYINKKVSFVRSEGGIAVERNLLAKRMLISEVHRGIDKFVLRLPTISIHFCSIRVNYQYSDTCKKIESRTRRLAT